MNQSVIQAEMFPCDASQNNFDQWNSHEVLIVHGAGEILARTQIMHTIS